MASMSETMDVSTETHDSDSYPSLRIPYVTKGTTMNNVLDAVKYVKLGTVDRVDFVKRTKKKGDKGFSVFIHFKKWGTNITARKARELVLHGGKFKLVHDDPSYWMVEQSYNPKHPRRPRKAHIVFPIFTDKYSCDMLIHSKKETCKIKGETCVEK